MYSDINSIPDTYFSSNNTSMIIVFYPISERDKLVLKNYDRIPLFYITYDEGGICSNDYIMMGMSANYISKNIELSHLSDPTKTFMVIYSSYEYNNYILVIFL